MLSVTLETASIRTRAGLGEDTSQDATLETIAAEQAAAIGATLIAGASGPDIDLGISEIVAAEFLEIVARDGGIAMGDLRLEAPDASALRARGEARLAPYRRDAGVVRAAGPR